MGKIYRVTVKGTGQLNGPVRIYKVIDFYDPLVESVSLSSNTCSMHTYNTGYVEFGISVK